MPRNLLIGPILAAAWLCALSCSYVVDTSEIDRGCGPGRKLCADKCVEQSDQAYGCTPDLCDPCRLTNAIPRCDGNTCVVNACLFGFDCPDETTGCFTNILVDRENCGHCDANCQTGESCSNGACVPGQAGSGN